ncbi:hypothetical protein SRB5_63680 [Streptomyces sp. RB5]|uniref:Uncharacterized protein n=1 Tax=Streptomyces smaragdinus TaxID=2585196 RepID=A0A7K0CT32_9ACTN|nr:hypothetical protein [Streptomyces smaragdinus]MQY16172.1 hypothetical protein [Streptomyces smaragdinus]
MAQQGIGMKMRGLRGPRRAGHLVSSAQLGGLALPMGDDGVVIGQDAENRPQIACFHHPQPYEVLLIGGLWTAQAIALRAAGTGSRVAVETGRAEMWTNLVRSATAGLEVITLHEPGRVPPLGPSVGSPVMIIRDCGVRPPRGRTTALPWQSVLTLVPYLGPAVPRLVEGAALVGIQRVSPEEAVQLGRLMQLPQADVDSLSTLGEGVTLWCTRSDRQYTFTQPTDAESQLLGTPRRLD